MSDLNDKYKFTTRLLTGGVSSTDKDNEWDKYITDNTVVGSDFSTWNHSNNHPVSWTSTTRTGSATAKTTRRGGVHLSSDFATATNTSSSLVAFRPLLTIQGVEQIPDTYYLIQDDEGIKTFDGADWALLDGELEELFKTQGMTTIPYHRLLELTSTKLLVWNKKEATSSRLHATPHDKLVLAEGDINGRIIDKVHDVSLKAENVKVVVSISEGRTWLTYEEDKWTEISLDKVGEKGIPSISLNSISAEKWTELFLPARTVRFGYHLSGRSYADKLHITFDSEGGWWASIPFEEHEVEYYNSKIKVLLYEGGDFKINY